MHVITLKDQDFTQACAQLERQISESGFVPDAIVGIANGGVNVAENMFPDVAHLSITCRRPGSEHKDGPSRLMALVRRMPLPVRDFLRKAEAVALIRHGNNLRRPEMEPDTRTALRAARSILVVDDAVDSGASLDAVLSAIDNVVSTSGVSRTVKAACITVTQNRPAAMPDYFIYHNRTLIRFPWSNDNPR